MHLDGEAVIAEYLAAAIENMDSEVFAPAVTNIAPARVSSTTRT
jgi:DNA-binding phage protein